MPLWNVPAEAEVKVKQASASAGRKRVMGVLRGWVPKGYTPASAIGNNRSRFFGYGT